MSSSQKENEQNKKAQKKSKLN